MALEDIARARLAREQAAEKLAKTPIAMSTVETLSAGLELAPAPLMRLADLAKQLGLTELTLRRFLDRIEFRAIQGKTLLFTEADVGQITGAMTALPHQFALHSALATDPESLLLAILATVKDRADAAERLGFVYFIQPINGGPIKIGTTIFPLTRLAALQSGHWEELRLLGQMRGGVVAERILHHRFASDRIRGEWFNPTERLQRHIELLLQRPTDD